MSRAPRDLRPPRSLRRAGDGALYDLDERRTITLAELAEEVRVGRRFRASREGSERDCTQQVLLEVLGAAGPLRPTSLASGGNVSGLAAAVGAIAGAIADRPGSGDARAWPRVRGRDDDATGRSSNGTARRRRPRLQIDGEE